MHRGTAFVPVFIAGILASGVAHADPPEAPRSVYRIEVSVTGLEENPRAAPATYVVDLLENQTGAVSTGANVPLGVAPGAPGGFAAPRQDVGLSLHFSYALRGGVVLLSGALEMSSIDPANTGTAVTIHRVRIEGVAPITPGTPAVFGSVFDLNSHRRYEVTVSARRLL